VREGTTTNVEIMMKIYDSYLFWCEVMLVFLLGVDLIFYASASG
jgi:hypothetical protein